MDKFHQTLIILQHFSNVIESRTNYCKRKGGFDLNSCVTNKMLDFIQNGFPISSFKDEKIIEQISRDCADLHLILHSYIRLNIIDLFSFNDEYNDYFKETVTNDSNISERIRKIRTLNKNIRNQIDWDKLKQFRNISFAHNLRDKKKSNEFSFENLKQLKSEFTSIDVGIKYSEVAISMFDNIKNEFANELSEAQKSMKKLTLN